MTTAISMGGGCAQAMTGMRGPDPGKLQQQFVSKVDTNGDASIDKTELKSLLDFVSEKTGATLDADAVLSAADSDGDGAISSAELESNGKALFDQLREQLMSSQLSSAPPPKPDTTDMFAGIDGDGSISKSALDAFISMRADGAGHGLSADAIPTRDDSDGDGAISLAEFEAAMNNRPAPPEGRGGHQAGRLIASLLDQYAANNASTSSPALSAVA